MEDEPHGSAATSELSARTCPASEPCLRRENDDRRVWRSGDLAGMADKQPFGHELTHTIIGAFYDVYNELGYGLLEGVYVAALRHELEARGLFVDREVWIDVVYKGQTIARQRIDLIVNLSVALEVKATEHLPPISHRQLLSYLRATHLELGLILHFGPEPRVYRLIDTRKRTR